MNLPLRAAAMLLALCTASPLAATPFDICADPGGAALNPGYRIQQKVVYMAKGPRWFCQVTPPGYAITNPDYPIVIVFHGGNGNPQTMMANNKAILEQVVNRGYVGMFPAGYPTESCDYADLPCADNRFGDDDNIDFINALLDHAAQFNLDEDRIFLAGFSGGARLIYRAIEADRFSLPITAIATAAGAMGLLKTDAPEEGFPMINVAAGTPVHALVMQSEDDPRMTYLGGLAEDEDELHLPFSVKVDLFRTLTGTLRTPTASIAGLPAEVTGTTHLGGTHAVWAITGTTDGHTWPAWLSPVAFDFFDQF